MLNITLEKFAIYKNICNEFLLSLKSNNLCSHNDVFTICKIISGYPYCLDQEGHFSYKGKFYDSMKDLPSDALNDLLCRLEHHGAI